jgi:hypothetical protein
MKMSRRAAVAQLTLLVLLLVLPLFFASALKTGTISSNAMIIYRHSVTAGGFLPARFGSTHTFPTERRQPCSRRMKRLSMIGYIPSEEEIEKQLARAKELLERSQAKIESGALGTNDESHGEERNIDIKNKTMLDLKTKRVMVTKVENKDGLVVVDGELMARYSEEEEWEIRPLMEVFEDDDSFQDENNTYYGLLLASTNTTKKLAQRDEVASIRNLQTLMNRQDFQNIFDERNFFIGEQ